ncbi:hypothetical protein ACFOG5_14260 [Pedobacter fastidiosus]|uniref:Uncharacterized protein n=1 Tax=Pedobacter fastidiosus TaxID=2765361 RepID=A0ABR7KLC7_9SPHI|nr:hypothetical protein [Pedobacter fastidiosus]MBC6108808.1 hypothetical protein [Pedobacter fastidiosus]
MFNIEFLSSLGKKTQLLNRNSAEVVNFCKGINWLQEIKNHYHAYRSDEYIAYEDYWYLDLSAIESRLNLNVFLNYIHEDQLHEHNLNFVVTLSWYHLEKTGWLTKFITRKEEKKVWDARHADEILVKDLEQIIKCFVEGDLAQLNSILPLEGEHQFDVD